MKIAHVDQSRDSLPDGETIWQAISGGEEILRLAGRELNSRAYCAQFGFTGADQSKKVGVLSGGERNRVHLARLLKSGANLILLDEPTAGLSPLAAQMVMRSLQAIHEQFGTTIILVEQNVHLALESVDRAIILKTGQIVVDGPAQTLRGSQRLWEWF